MGLCVLLKSSWKFMWPVEWGSLHVFNYVLKVLNKLWLCKEKVANKELSSVLWWFPGPSAFHTALDSYSSFVCTISKPECKKKGHLKKKEKASIQTQLYTN